MSDETNWKVKTRAGRGQTSSPITARVSVPHDACLVLQEGVIAAQVLMSFPSYPTAGEDVG